MGLIKLHVIVLIMASFATTKSLSAKEALMAHLIDNHPAPIIRPVRNHTTILNISFTFEVNRLIGLNSVEQSVTFVIWTTMSWYDEYLTWDVKDYENITSIRLAPDALWDPGLFFQNRVQGYKDPDQYESPPWVLYDGTVEKSILSVTQFLCKLNMTKYPHDEQICYGEIYTEYFKEEINIAAQAFVGKGSEYGSSEYKINDVSVSVDELMDMKLRFNISRISSFIPFSVTKPTMMLYFVTTLSLLLPPDSEAKIDILMNVLIAFSVLMMILSDQLPVSQESPMILNTMMDAMIVDVVCLAVSILSIRISTIEDIQPNPTVEKVLAVLGKAVLLPYPLPSSTKTKPQEGLVVKLGDEKTDSRLTESLIVITDWLENMDEEGRVKHFWNHLACIIDRIFFLVFLILTIKYGIEEYSS